MPEAFAVLFVFVVAVAAYVGARLNAGNPIYRDACAEVARAQQQRAWLASRLEQARSENWEPDMQARIADELAALDAQLARSSSGRCNAD